MSATTEPVDWTGRLDAVAAWLPTATRAAVETFALSQFVRGEGAWALARQSAAMDEARAQREASWAVSGALDWSAQARRPSHAEIAQRRGEPVDRAASLAAALDLAARHQAAS